MTRLEADIERGPVQGTEAGLDAGRALFDVLLAANGELLGFWRERLERSSELTRRLAACRSVEEALDAHGEHARDMVGAYATLWARLAAPFTDAADQAARGPGADKAPPARARAA